MLNELCCIGALGRDAEVRKAGDFYAVQFNLATAETWKDKEGNKQEKTTWIDCTRWLKNQQPAENLAKYLKKGTKLYVKGLASARAYKNDNTNEMIGVLCLRVDDLKIIHTTAERTQSSNATPPPVTYADDDDDLPF